MRVLYNFFIYFFGFVLRLAALFGNEKAKRWKEGRKDLFKQLENKLPKDREKIWFHCASLGEFEQARPLLEKIKKDFDQYYIVLSFFSPSGYENKKNYSHADLICYLPLDTPSNARRFVSILQPKLSFFAKYEFWFNILLELHKQQFPHFLISGVFRPKQQFFRFYGKWFRDHLARFSHLYLQDESSAQLLRSFNIQNCTVSGDGRFDRVAEIAKAEFRSDKIEKFVDGKTTVVFGSSWEKENDLAFQLAKNNDLKIIIAPHEFHKAEMENLGKKHGKQLNYFSKQETAGDNILIIDQMGLLAKLYRYADLVIIGGGFGKGIHNILEAAVYGKPILFGPKYDFFLEAKDLIEAEGAKVFKNEKQFHQLCQEVLSNAKHRLEMGKACREYFDKKTGSTELIFKHLRTINYL